MLTFLLWGADLAEQYGFLASAFLFFVGGGLAYCGWTSRLARLYPKLSHAIDTITFMTGCYLLVQSGVAVIFAPCSAGPSERCGEGSLVLMILYAPVALISVLGALFLFSRRDSSGKPTVPDWLNRD